ncbi:hypothetical protein ERUR111494_04865 [Erysipelothrix urinaevulpis]|uniref:hypothetical protein n=1 Tax=Erysipelothrix urinaevulpis TaxID=2683717 RepID=UPI00135B907C|nr:hypothetical protein [Erysipelothrix urinaevulpis]
MKLSILVYACIIYVLTILVQINNYAHHQHLYNNFSHLYHRTLQTTVHENLKDKETIREMFDQEIKEYLPKNSRYWIDVKGFHMNPRLLRVKFKIKYKDTDYEFDQTIVEEIADEEKN